MLLTARSARRAVAGTVGAGAVAGAMLFGAIPSALADPQPAPPPVPPNCTAGDLARVAAGVSASTSAYLFANPPVNEFFTSLEGMHRDDVRAEAKAYMDQNPKVKGEMTAIRQPLVDLKNRCGATEMEPELP